MVEKIFYEGRTHMEIFIDVYRKTLTLVLLSHRKGAVRNEATHKRRTKSIP